jgi:hypothetical protein
LHANREASTAEAVRRVTIADAAVGAVAIGDGARAEGVVNVAVHVHQSGPNHDRIESHLVELLGLVKDAAVAAAASHFLNNLPLELTVGRATPNLAHSETKRYASQEVRNRLIECGHPEHFAIDDSIRLVALDLSGGGPGGPDSDGLSVTYSSAPGLQVSPTDMQPTPEQIELSMASFDEEVRAYLRAEIARDADKSNAEWKLGLTAVCPPADPPPACAEMKIDVAPLSYRVTNLFNRALVHRRVSLFSRSGDRAPALGQLYDQCAKAVLSGFDYFALPCPSQLFVEVALVTADGFVVLVKKMAGKGVVAGINRAWTCGPEFGFALRHLKDGSSILVAEGIFEGLEKEFGIARQLVRRWHIAGLALQHVHLNAALYGHCELDVSGAELVASFRETRNKAFYQSVDGAREYPELVPLDSVRSLLDNESQRYDGGMWHPTARIRLHSVLDRAGSSTAAALR